MYAHLWVTYDILFSGERLGLSKVWVHDLATGRYPSCSLKFGFPTWQLGDASRALSSWVRALATGRCHLSSKKKKKKKNFVFTTWHLGDANRALYSLGSRLGNWEMPIVLSNLIGTRAKKWGIYVYISIYIIIWTINTSTTNIPASATYMTAIPRVTTREWFPAHRPCVLHVLHSFSPYLGLFPFISL